MYVLGKGSIGSVINTKLHRLSLLKWPATRVDGGLVHLQVHSLFTSDCSQSAIMIKARQSSSHAAMPFPNSKEVKFVEAEYSSIFPVHGLLRILVYLGLSPQVTLALFRNDGNQGDRLRTSRFVCIAKADLARPRAAGSYYGVIALLVPAAAVSCGHWISSIPLCLGMRNLKMFIFVFSAVCDVVFGRGQFPW